MIRFARESLQIKTPVGKKVVFDDDDNQEFVTPLEGPSKSGLEMAGDEDEEEEEEEDDDDDAPEAISSHAAKAQNEESANAATKAAQK